MGQTLYYKPTLETVVPHIFCKGIDKSESIPEIKAKSIENICEIMESKNHYNLRTLQFALTLFNKVLNDYVDKKDDPAIYCEAMPNVMEAILNVAIADKNGETAYEWSHNGEYGNINLSKTLFNYSNYFFSFKFIHNYVCYGIYDLTNIQLVLEAYIEEISAKSVDLSDPTNILINYWEMDDDDILNQLSTLFGNLNAGKYKGRSYGWILSLIFKLKGLGFEPVPVEQFFSIMEKNVRNDNLQRSMQEPIISKTDDYWQEYLDCLEKLGKLKIKSSEASQSDTVNEIFNIGEGWGSAFSDYYFHRRRTSVAEDGIFKYIDIDKCFDAIEKSAVKDMSDFRRSIYSLYDYANINDRYLDDIPNIEKLLSMLKADYDKKMKNFNVNLLIDSLKEIKSRLSDQNEDKIR